MKYRWWLTLALAGCAAGRPLPPSPPAAPPPSAVVAPPPVDAEPAATTPPAVEPPVVEVPALARPAGATCATVVEVRARVDEVCTVVGTYELREITNKAGGAWRTWPVVTLGGGGFVALESVWDETKLPGADEIARWRGKRVAVTGRVLSAPPRELPGNMAMLTVAPVESIALAP